MLPVDSVVDSASAPAPTPPSVPPLRGHNGLSKPVEPLGAAEVTLLNAAAQVRKERWKCRRCGLDPALGRFATGTERLTDGTKLHLASLRFVDTPLYLQGAITPPLRLSRRNSQMSSGWVVHP